MMLIATMPLPSGLADAAADIFVGSAAEFTESIVNAGAAPSEIHGKAFIFGAPSVWEYTAALETPDPAVAGLAPPAKAVPFNPNPAYHAGVRAVWVPANETTASSPSSACTSGCAYAVAQDGRIVRWNALQSTGTTLTPAGLADLGLGGRFVGYSAFYDGHFLYVFVGTAGGVVTETVLRYDLAANRVHKVDIVPGSGAIFPFSHASVVWVPGPDGLACSTGCAYFFGGRSQSGELSAVQRFDPVTRELMHVRNLPAIYANYGGAMSQTSATWSGTAAYVFGLPNRDSNLAAGVARFDPPSGWVPSQAEGECERVAPAWLEGKAVLFGGDQCNFSADLFIPVQSAIPTVPSSVSASGSTGAVALRWKPPVNDGGVQVEHYNVYRETASATFTLIATPDDSTPYYVDTGRTDGVTYNYRVSATNDIGEGLFASASATAGPSAPSVPETLTAAPGAASATLSWSPPLVNGGSSISGYRVFRGTTCDALAHVTDVASSPYTDTGLTNGQTYCYALQASNALGNSALSDAASVRPRTVPTEPTSLAGVPKDKSVVLSWSSPSTDGGAPIGSYVVYRTPPGGVEAEIATMVPEARTFTDTGLTNGATYGYRLSAQNEAGEGVKTALLEVVPSTVPTAPRNVVLEPHSQRIEVDWTVPLSDGGAPITSYVVTRAAGVVVTVFNVDATQTSFSDVNLTNNVEYCYTIKAVNLQGASVASARVCAFANAVPSAPQGIENWRHKGADISWFPPKYEGDAPLTHYVVCWAPATKTVYTCYEDEPVYPPTSGTRVTYTDPHPVSDASLINCYVVYAVNSFGDGRFSAEVCLKTA